MPSANIPSLHHSTRSRVTGSATVAIQSRQDAAHTGKFAIKVDATFDPSAAPFYPSGSLSIRVDLTDSVKGTFVAKTIEVMNSYGKHNPTVVLTGKCDGDLTNQPAAVKGYHYWIMIADDKPDGTAGTPDVISFVICDSTGDRVAYGSGLVIQGDLQVSPN